VGNLFVQIMAATSWYFREGWKWLDLLQLGVVLCN